MQKSLNQLRTRTIEVLRKLERITHTDNVYLVKNTWIIGISQLLALLNGFVVYILIARYVSPTLFGQYRYLIAIFEMASVTTLTGMKVALLKSVSNGYEGSLQTAVKTRLAWGYSLGGVLLLGASWYALQGNTSLAAALCIMYVLGPVYYATSSYGSFLQGKKQFKSLSVISVINEVCTLVGMLFAIFFARTPVQFFLAYLIANLNNVVFYLYAKKTQQNQNTDPELQAHAKHQSKMDVLLSIMSRLDGVIIFHLLGSAPLAGFAFISLAVEQVKMLVSSVYTVAGPKLATNDLASILKSLYRKLILMGILGAVLAIVYTLLAKTLFAILFPAYADMVAYSQVYSATLVFVLPALYGSFMLNVKHIKRETSLYNMWGQSVAIVLVLSGGLQWGLWGIMYAKVVASAAQLLILVILLKSLEKNQSSTR